jgi:hypothetical protein
LDFGLYQFPFENNKSGKHIICLSTNGKLLTGEVEKCSVKKLISIWKL